MKRTKKKNTEKNPHQNQNKKIKSGDISQPGVEKIFQLEKTGNLSAERYQNIIFIYTSENANYFP